MTSLRLLAAAAMGAVLAAFAAGALSLRRDAPAPPAVPAARVAELPQAEPLPPLPAAFFSGADRPRVPAGILARAANARALDRGPSCPQVETPEEPPRCAPGQRESIEIEWHAAPRDP